MVKQNKRVFLAILACFCIICFWPSLFDRFTDWDDNAFLIQNPAVHGLGLQHLKDIFTERVSFCYQPLTMLSLAIEYHFFKLNPFIYHLDNLVLHIGNVCLVFLIINLLTEEPAVAFITALLFAVSPLRVESVAWVSERKDVLYAFFFLLSMIAYLRNRSWLAFGFFVLSCLAKCQGVFLPVTFILLDYWHKRRGISLWTEKWPFFLFGAVILGISTTGVLPNSPGFDSYNPLDKLFLSAFAFVLYIVKIFVPVQLALVYPYPFKINGAFPWEIYASPVVIALTAVIILRYRRRHPVIWAGSLFFCAAIFLPLMTVAAGAHLHNDQYTYLASIGLYWILAHSLWHCFDGRLRTAAVVLVSVYILLLGALTFQRCKVWYDAETLWSDLIDRYPQNAGFNAKIYNNRGLAYEADGHFDKALSDYDKSIELYPYDAGVFFNRGTTYAFMGIYDRALPDLNKAIELYPQYTQAYFERANVYGLKGDLNQTIADLTQAIKIQPDFANAYVNRAVAYYLQKDYARAWADVYRARELGVVVKPKLIQALRQAARMS